MIGVAGSNPVAPTIQKGTHDVDRESLFFAGRTLRAHPEPKGQPAAPFSKPSVGLETEPDNSGGLEYVGNTEPTFARRGWQYYASLGLRGVCMGAADVIPGVSGGTIAFVTGIYEELIFSIRTVDGTP